MIDKHEPAFPAVNNESAFYAPGLTKLEYFACNAPKEIPSWFVHVSPDKLTCQQPSFDDIENVDDRQLCRSWLMDSCFDLPDHLKWFQDKTEQASANYSENVRKDNEARYFQWRRFYAEQLLSTLSTPQL